MDWKKLLTTALFWVVIISTPAGPITTRHAFHSQADCQSFLTGAIETATNPANQKEVNTVIRVNPKGVAALARQAQCVEH